MVISNGLLLEAHTFNMGTQGALFYKSSGHTFRTIRTQGHIISGTQNPIFSYISPKLAYPLDKRVDLYFSGRGIH